MYGTATYNINVHELDETSPIGNQPHNVKIPLKRHQLTLLQRCIEFETSKIPFRLNDNGAIEALSVREQQEQNQNIGGGGGANQNPSQPFIRTHIGILGDKVGSGKSFVVLSLVVQDLPIPQEPLIRTFAENNIIVCSQGHPLNVRTNLLVIPHNLMSQWTSYIQAFSDNLRTLVCCKSRHVEALYNNINIADYDLMVVSCTFYNRVAAFLNERNYRVRRVIYDEADNMNIPSCLRVNGYFYWFVTASFGNLLYPKGHSDYDSVQRRYVMHAYGLCNAGFIKNMFIDMWSHADSSSVSRMIVVKNTDAYIAQSIELPPVVNHLVRCRTPYTIGILAGIVDKHIIDCLNADDVPAALEYINPQHKRSEDNIITMLIDKYQKQIKNLDVRIEYTQFMEYDREEDRRSEVERINQRRKEIEQKIESIKARIKESDTCCICYDTIDRKTIVPCCTNSYCFKCLNIWLDRNKSCPLCKSPVTISDFYVVDAMHTEPVNPAELEDHSMEVHEFNDKVKNLENILRTQTNANSRYLIFSSYDSSFDNVIRTLDVLKIRHAFLKGNMYHINNLVEQYKAGGIQVLLVNPRSYGSGLNLENTTDVIMFHKFDTEIEKQVIGRAQRYGRTDSLRVWYLLYNNEMAPDPQAAGPSTQ